MEKFLFHISDLSDRNICICSVIGKVENAEHAYDRRFKDSEKAIS